MKNKILKSAQEQLGSAHLEAESVGKLFIFF